MAQRIPFSKSFVSSSDLISLLSERGMQIDDALEVAQCLDNIGYYRLSAYMYPLLDMPKNQHLFKRGVSFCKVVRLYSFDEHLRLLLFDEIEKVEIAIRRAVMQIPVEMMGDSFWLTSTSYFLDLSKYNDTIRIISSEYAKSKEEFVMHYKDTYIEDFPPSWIVGELLSIGTINAIYRNIKYDRVRKQIARRFGLPISVFESWLTVIAVTRNACAHHARVWNKRNAIVPSLLNNPLGRWITISVDPCRIYFDICIIKYLLNIISPNNDMLAKLRWLFHDFPEVDLAAMGFPQNWEMEPLWR
ncbi:MAG: Abi family protein [Bacteroidia bacterium]|nr:Abi family protein [Bacteroidia bacterium]